MSASHPNNTESKPYEVKCINNAIPVMAVSSNEARVSIPSRKVSNGAPGTSPVTGAHAESIVSVPISAAGDACCFSEDMGSNVLEDKTPLSKDESIRSIK